MKKDYRALIKKALAQKDADYCEIRIEESHITTVAFQGEEIHAVTSQSSFGGNVRALKRGAWGFTSFNDLSNLEGKVSQTCAQAAILGERVKNRIHLCSVPPVEDKVLGNFKEEAFKVPLQKKIQILSGYNHIMLKSPGIVSSTVRYVDKHSHIHYGNTDNTFLCQEKMDVEGIFIPIAAKEGLSTQDSFSFGSSEDFNVIYGLEEMVENAAESAKDMLDSEVIEGGEYTAILSPQMAGLFVHEAFGHLSEADFLDENEKMKDLLKIGTEYGPAELNIYDTGIAKGMRGESKYDDEGVPSQLTPLIANGVVAGHLHSRETAWKMGAKPTGNARAINYRHPPIVRMCTTCIGPGPNTLEEMLLGVRLGIYVGGGYGGETNLEMFTFAGSRCKMIRNGAFSETVRDVNLSGNVFHTLNNIDMIGNDFTLKNTAGGCGKGGQSPLPVAQGSPHIRIQKVVVGGRKK